MTSLRYAFDIISIFVMSVGCVCDVIAPPETGRFQNDFDYLIFLNYNFRKWLFYIDKCVCSQFYYLIPLCITRTTPVG